jgi:hypothetical protein
MYHNQLLIYAAYNVLDENITTTKKNTHYYTPEQKTKLFTVPPTTCVSQNASAGLAYTTFGPNKKENYVVFEVALLIGIRRQRAGNMDPMLSAAERTVGEFQTHTHTHTHTPAACNNAASQGWSNFTACYMTYTHPPSPGQGEWGGHPVPRVDITKHAILLVHRPSFEGSIRILII